MKSNANYWFQGIRSCFDTDDNLPLTDVRIRSATHFVGHGRNYLEWSKAIGYDPEKGPPCHDLDMNAFHVSYLAQMIAANLQICNDLQVSQHRHVVDGHHRVRAVKYLFQARQILIPAPEQIKIHLGGIDPKAPTDACLFGDFADLDQLVVIMDELKSIVDPARHVKWLMSPVETLENRTPLATLQGHEFEKVRNLICELQTHK